MVSLEEKEKGMGSKVSRLLSQSNHEVNDSTATSCTGRIAAVTEPSRIVCTSSFADETSLVAVRVCLASLVAVRVFPTSADEAAYPVLRHTSHDPP